MYSKHIISPKRKLFAKFIGNFKFRIIIVIDLNTLHPQAVEEPSQSPTPKIGEKSIAPSN